MRTVAIVQARMGSTRLPGKTLMPLAGRPMLARVVERVRSAKRVQDVTVATSGSPADAPIARLCEERHWSCFRGSEEDVLDRYRNAARAADAGVVVRITADCPVIDPGLIDDVIAAYVRERCDYASNGLEPRTFPRGLDAEVFSRKVLDRAWKEDTNKAWREHVTPYIYRHPERFKLHRVANEVDLSAYRWTVDTAEDYNLLCRIYEHFRDGPFGWLDVLRLVDEHPDWQDANRNVHQKVVP